MNDRLSWRDGLSLDHDGRPSTALRALHLDEWADADPAAIAELTEELSATALVTVGIAMAPPSAALRPVLEVLALTLVPQAVPPRRELVTVADPLDQLHRLTDRVASRPQASLALVQLLTQTAALPAYPALAAEAATYSMLLSGTEFHRWLRERPASWPRSVTGELVRVERDAGRLEVTLADPERRNAFSFALREELYAALELALLDDTIDEVVLRGDGPVFSSGGDLNEFGTASDLVAAFLVRLDRGPWRLLERLRTRTTVHLQGAAVGAGLELAAFAGKVVCARGTELWLPEVSMGLVPGAGGTVSVVRRIGRWRAAWLALTGDRLDAETALAWGLVDELDG